MWKEMAHYKKILKKTNFLALEKNTKIVLILVFFSLKANFGQTNVIVCQTEYDENRSASPNKHFG